MKEIQKFRITVYDLFDHDEFESIYDDLYLPQYKEIVKQNHLTCCNIISSVYGIKDTWETLLHLYEGMCYNVEAFVDGKYEHIIGGTFDPGDYDYIQEYIDKHKEVMLRGTATVTVDIPFMVIGSQSEEMHQIMDDVRDHIASMTADEFAKSVIIDSIKVWRIHCPKSED